MSAHSAAFAAHHTAGAAKGHAGLLGAEIHAHAAAAACGQHCAAGDGHRAVGIQGGIICGVCSPYGHRAAGNGDVTVGIKAIAGGGVGNNGAAGDVECIAVAAEGWVGGVDAVVGGCNAYIAGIDVDGSALQSLTAGGDGDAGTGGAFCADVHGVIAVQGIVPGGNGQSAAFHIQGGFCIDGIIYRCGDVQCQLPDGEAGIPFAFGGSAGFDAVFAVCNHV